MPGQRNRSQADDPVKVERAVILQILSKGREQRLSHAELKRELSDIAPEALNKVLLSLARAGAIERSHETVWVSRAAQRLDELDLIGV